MKNNILNVCEGSHEILHCVQNDTLRVIHNNDTYVYNNDYNK